MAAVVWALITFMITSLLAPAANLIYLLSKKLGQISAQQERISTAFGKAAVVQEEIVLQQAKLAVMLLRLQRHEREGVREAKALEDEPRVRDGSGGREGKPLEPELLPALKETQQGQQPPPALPLAQEGTPDKGFQQPVEPVLAESKEPPRVGKHSRSGGSPEPKPRGPPLSEPLLQQPRLFPSGMRSAALGGSSEDPTASVTGVQRFQEALKRPYRLALRNEPGRADLKHVVIDGSNVAMAHGLKKFFSCRGIALAVEYFWKLGNRNITVFVPQWRTRRDPHVTEQHLLGQLQELGIVALTPARMVSRERISSHDDRFLLHLADKTGGIIVTNDNLREFVTESASWREIVARRLLQYTFVGDIFMVPDDPLGRRGPRLEEFLRKDLFSADRQLVVDSGPPGMSTLDSDLRSRSPSHWPPPQIHGSSPSPGLPHQQLFTAPVILPRMQQKLARHAQRSWAETSQLREALMRIFLDSEHKGKIDQIRRAHPSTEDLTNALSGLVLDAELG
ncbi:LOW QUALITY PROTEIN: NEDD4-binding protein 1-like [Psammomys obesus]|uniref:LOW QUALITY PROTEIN: NEDD4-binding protein 1-like n=1 Tax=Psammomys obesus TaxID=48139 RepID=UPI0024529FC7|nr:LOW QUALITY PROTEIN: NEDD4-binding protein 1-like [Psammomys obesus]